MKKGVCTVEYHTIQTPFCVKTNPLRCYYSQLNEKQFSPRQNSGRFNAFLATGWTDFELIGYMLYYGEINQKEALIEYEEKNRIYRRRLPGFYQGIGKGYIEF